MNSSTVLIFMLWSSIVITKGCPPLYEPDRKNSSICLLCPPGQIKIGHGRSSCFLYKTEEDINMYNVLRSVYRNTYGLRDLLPDSILYDPITRWTKEACVTEPIKQGEKEKKRLLGKMLNLIHHFIKEREIFDKI